MAACIHGDVCRAWMRQTGARQPLSCNCPHGCQFYEKDKYKNTYNGYNRPVMRDICGNVIFYC